MSSSKRARRVVSLGASLAVVVLACLQSSVHAQIKPKNKKIQAAGVPNFGVEVKPVIAKFCVKCHSGADAAGGIDLAKLVASPDYAHHGDVWDKVYQRLTAKSMPPSGMAQPTEAQRHRVTNWIEVSSENLCKLQDPGRVTIRRLNREEYNNTIRDLIGLDLRPADDFPSDDVGYGFDNIGDVLSVSPLLMEKYLNAAQRVANAALVMPGVHTQHFEATDMSEAGGASNADEGGRLYFTNAECFQTVNLRVAGSYRFRAYAAGDLAGPELPKMQVTVDGRTVTTFDVSTKRGHAQMYEIPISFDAGKHKVGIAFTNDYYNTKDPPGKQDRNLWLGYFELTGPLDASSPLPASHMRIIPHQPTAETMAHDARQFLSDFALRAFRRPPTLEEVDRLYKVFEVGKSGSGNFEEGIKLGVEAVLVSPNFLFRVELDPKAQSQSGGVRSLNDYELASRLSYFLWSSMPDGELFDLAKQGKLHQTSVLNAQVERMLQDPKSRALADNFAGQWLQLRKLAIVDPDPGRFPGIDGTMKQDMATETKMFFNAVLHENRPITDFIDGKYTFVNERLAKLYGIPGVGGNGFQKVDLTGERGGVLTQASVLTVTSNPTRTSPTKRGKWVLEQILGTPPPPPPPGVGVINDEQHKINAKTLRQLMEEHRKNPMCAACHAKMDPIGFGLENFDAVGRWRTKDGDFPLDTTGTLPDGRSFNGPEQLKKILIHDKDHFAHALAEKLLTYGLGRGATASDKCALDATVALAAAHNYKFDVLITAVVDSDPFRKRSGDTLTK